ncbi:MAG: hypothetical protein R3360_09780, partial [Alphaproteobacteria bacterium]|nr:hypothetical protein [Alphaproteobacteria bacterium]
VSLEQGQAVVIRGADDPLIPIAVDPYRMEAFHRGFLVAEDEKLSTLLTRLNAYYRVPILLGDQSLGDLTVTGTLKYTDRAAVLEAFEQMLPVRVEAAAESTLLQPKK